MQQTENYKLNKPGMDDTFSTAPLNENADKVEAALSGLAGGMAGIELRPCLIRLCDSSGSTASGSKISFRIPEGVDLAQYRALVFVYYVSASGNSTLKYNEESLLTVTYGAGTTNLQSGVGFAALTPVGNYIYAMSVTGSLVNSSNSGTGRLSGGRIVGEWASLTGEFTFVGVSKDSWATVYGLRA